MSENKVCFLCLIGLPGAGKSYLANVISVNKIGFTRVEHVSFDELIEWDGLDKMVMWKDKRRSVSAHVETLVSDFIKEDSDKQTLLIILDDNMYYRSMRYEFFRLAKRMKSKYCQVFLNTPLEICCKRNKSRASSLPTNHIINMNEKLEPPSEHHYWEKYSLTIMLDIDMAESLKSIKDLIIHSKEPSVIEENSFNAFQTAQSYKHLADIALRKLVSQFIQKIKCSEKDNMPARVEQVINSRQEILYSIANGNLSLPNLSTVDDYIEHLTPIFQSSVLAKYKHVI